MPAARRRTREAAIGRFRRIFRKPQAPRYVLEDVRVTIDGAGATARGRFMAEGNDLYGTGEIEFRLSRHGDKVLIDSLDTVPDINQRVPVQREGIPVDAEITVRMQRDGTLPKGTVIAERSFTIERYEPGALLPAAAERGGQAHRARREVRDPHSPHGPLRQALPLRPGGQRARVSRTP